MYKNRFLLVGIAAMASGIALWSCGIGATQSRPLNQASLLLSGNAESVRESAQAPADQAWIARAIRTLHPGRRATAEQISSFLGKPKGDVVDKLIADPAFSEMVLDYSLVFLGQAPNPSRSLEQTISFFDPFFQGSTLAGLNAAYQYDKNGEYLALLDYRPPAYMPKLVKPSRNTADYKGGAENELPELPDVENLLQGTDTQIRIALVAHVTQLAGDLEASFKQAGSTDALCASSTDPTKPTPFIALRVRMNAAAHHVGLRAWARQLFAGSLDAFDEACSPDSTADAQARLALAQAGFVRLNLLLKSLPSIVSDLEKRSASADDSGIASLIPFDFGQLPQALQPPRLPEPLSFEFFGANANSSTNFNRRRAATILKRYFCDNLIPLEIALPSDGSNHGAGRHASEPACQSCHYKLDPMAGFFRSKGVDGFEFLDPSQGERNELEQARDDFRIPADVQTGHFLVYDDLSVVMNSDLNRYLDNWRFRNSDGTPVDDTAARPWNVGYVRSLSHPERNDYGSNLADLFEIIRRSPEVKRCMTQRLADYIMGTGLRYDPAWVDALAQPLIAAGQSGQGSSQALRDTVKALVLSNSFNTRDPDPSTCYDRMDPTSPVPCEVASIIQQSCAQSCHSSAVKLGRLALDTWIPDTSRAPLMRGQFDHRDQSGNALAPATSFARIKERIMTGDPNLRMPPQEMDQRARTELYLWLEAREREVLQ